MIHFSLRLLAVTVTVGCAAVASALTPDTLTYDERRQADVKSSSKLFFIGNGSEAPKDSIDLLLSRFYMDQFRHSQDPELPYFLLLSKDASLAFGIGGTIRMRGWYGWNGAIQANGFAPYLIPIPKDPVNPRNLGGTPAGTTLFFTMLGRKAGFGQLTGYIECNFDGYNGVGFKLKKAYVTINDFTIGYASSTFSDPGAMAPTIDGAGPNGKMSHTSLLVRYIHTLRNGLSFAGSVEMPSQGVQAVDGLSKSRSVYVPDVAAFMQYSWGHGSHVRLAGLAKVLAYRDIVSERNYSPFGWGLQLSGVWAATSRVNLYAAANVGQGIGSYSGDLAADHLDLIYDPQRPGKLYTPKMWSAAIGGQYYFSKNVYGVVTGSMVRFMPHHDVAPDTYRTGLYCAANIFWNITSRLQVGFEYLYGQRWNFSGAHAAADRVDALFQFAF